MIILVVLFTENKSFPDFIVVKGDIQMASESSTLIMSNLINKKGVVHILHILNLFELSISSLFSYNHVDFYTWSMLYTIGRATEQIFNTSICRKSPSDVFLASSM